MPKKVEKSEEVKKVEGQDVYMAMGGHVYKLAASEMIHGSEVVALAKKVAAEEARKEAKIILDNAHASASVLVKNAIDQRREATKLLDEAKKQVVPFPPHWAIRNNVPVRFDREHEIWSVRVLVQFCIQFYDYNFCGDGGKVYRCTWLAKPVDSKLLTLWVPLEKNGCLTVSTIRLDKACPVTPHMNHTSTCLSMGDVPPKLENMDHLIALGDSLYRVLQRVQLEDLMTHVEDLDSLFKETMPDELYAAWKVAHGVIELAKKSNPQEVDVKEKVWQA